MLVSASSAFSQQYTYHVIMKAVESIIIKQAITKMLNLQTQWPQQYAPNYSSRKKMMFWLSNSACTAFSQVTVNWIHLSSSTITWTGYLECEFVWAHHFNDIKCRPADLVPQHLQLKIQVQDNISVISHHISPNKHKKYMKKKCQFLTTWGNNT